MFRIKAVEKIKTRVLCSVTFENHTIFLANVEKYCRAGQATDDHVAHANWMLDTSCYKHLLRICNTYCFPTATVVARTRVNVTLCVHFLCC